MLTFGEAFRAGFAQRLSSTGERRIGHEIAMRVKWLLVTCGYEPFARTGGKDCPALLVIEQIGQHNLVQNLLMNRRVEDWKQNFHPAVKVSSHQVSRRYVNVSM